ncbi:MAG: glycine-rich protein [Tenericutes bacterium]|nr:glycine-rich protein [Mycoplasmatota bacterium]
MKKAKKIYIVTVILLIISIGYFYASYAFFNNTKEEHGKLNIVAGDLKYKLESDSLDNGKIVIGASETKEFIVNLTSLNEIDSKYELYYRLDTNNSDINVAYSSSSIDSVSGTIEAKGKKTITVKIENNGNTSSTVYIGVVGGLVNKKLVLGSGNNSLNKDTIISRNGLSSVILANNTIITDQPTLSTSSNNTKDTAGLYKSTDTNSGNPTYYFRGNVTNNYVSFAGFTWRIVRINEDGSVRLILQTGINNKTYSYGSTSNMYYSDSNAKITLDDWYNTNLANYDSYISRTEYCEALNVTWNSNFGADKATPVSFGGYNPTFKCLTDGNGYGIVNSQIGLLRYDEAVFAGGYPTKGNSSYYLYNGSTTRTMSPSGKINNGTNHATTWYLNGTSSTSYSITYDTNNGVTYLRPVINIISNASVTGTGTSSDPYKITGIEYNDTYDATLVNNSYSPTLTSTTYNATKVYDTKTTYGSYQYSFSSSGYYYYCCSCNPTHNESVCPGTSSLNNNIAGTSCGCTTQLSTYKYVCNSGDTLDNSTGICIKNQYSCPNGGTLSSDGKTCINTTYKCNDGDILSGTKCTKYSNTMTFDYTGNEQKFTVQKSGTYKLEVWGAQGGSYSTTYYGGYGGYSTGIMKLNANTNLYINIGGQGVDLIGGYNGGGPVNDSNNGKAGGGATHISTTSSLLSSLSNQIDSILIVAGGGGGAAQRGGQYGNGNGGSAGGYIGSNGESVEHSNGYGYAYGSGGTQDSGGHIVWFSSTQLESDKVSNTYGYFGKGGGYYGNSTYAAAGGGGGFYGGGSSMHGGAGGGSGYIGNSLLANKAMYCYNCSESTKEATKTISTTCNANLPVENCAKQGNGYARITYLGD